MSGVDSGREFAAGWIDGSRATGVEVRNRVRRELLRYGHELAPDDTARPSSHPDAAPRAVPSPDNPLDDASYLEGWDAGRSAGCESIARRLRAALAEHDLYVSDAGAVIRTALVDDLVRWYRARVETDQTVTDASLHAFIDGAEATAPGTPRPSRRHPAATNAADTTLKPSNAIKGACKMIRNAIDRRTIIATLAGVVAGVGGYSLLTSETPTNLNSGTVTLAQDGDVTTPAYWKQLDPMTQAQLTGLHAAVESLEEQGQQAVVHQYLQSGMAMPQAADHWKHVICAYVGDLRRADLLPDLLPGLSPAITSAEKRIKIVSTVRQLCGEPGALSVAPQLRGQLKAYLASNVETDGTVVTFINRILEEL